jgi:hypothetical protein
MKLLCPLFCFSLAKKWQIDNLFTMGAPWEAPEMMTHPDDADIVKQIIYEVIIG